MSTCRTGYVILGVELAEIDVLDGFEADCGSFRDACEEAGLEEVYDGMNGNYHIVGNVIQKGEYDSGNFDGAEMTSWKTGELAADAIGIARSLTELLGVPVNVNQIKLFSFTHWH